MYLGGLHQVHAQSLLGDDSENDCDQFLVLRLLVSESSKINLETLTF